MKSLKQLYKIGYGPSASHSMGPAYAVKIFKKSHPSAKSYKAILYGSLALTGKGHLTDQAIIKNFYPSECIVEFDLKSTNIKHPNTFDLLAYYDTKIVKTRFYSIGGGDLEIEGYDKPLYEDIYPHNNYTSLKKYLTDNNISIVDYVKTYEGDDIVEYLTHMYEHMVETINNGLNKEGYLPGELKVVRKAKEIYNTKLVDESLLEKKEVYAYAFAVSEENASGEEIVTAPTCGSCGLLPAVLYHCQNKYKYSDEKIVEALMVAGIIGNIVKTNASISGAEAGCQAEIGTATSMAAAAYAYLIGANLNEIEIAAEAALEHLLGLTCDPIKGYVQIPCIERNAVCAIRAIDAGKLAIFIKPNNSKISFDTVVRTMLKTGKDLNSKYRETAKGGLAKEYKI